MRERRRILSSPLHLAGGLGLDQIGSLVSIDATLRWWEAVGEPGEAAVVSFAGSLATQHAVQRELAKEGHDRESLGRDAFIDRVRASEAKWRNETADLLCSLRIDAAGRLAYASTDTAAVVDAARVAFVRLFDAGLLSLASHVVDVCPRCGTVVHAADAERGTIEAELLTVRLALSGGGHTDVPVTHPELIAGAVAVAVPPGDAAEGDDAVLPLLGRRVPVVAAAGVHEPTLVVPAHDAVSYEIAQREGLRPVEVLDHDGTVCEPAALVGLPRFAARAEAAALLGAEGVVEARRPIDDPVSRCRGCGTVLVPRLGRHWFLRTGPLEVAVADAVRQGALTFSPPSARNDFINWVGYSDDWCISHQVWGGHPIPVALCTDCGEPSVGIDPPPACRKCMAELAPDTAVFDARFLGVIWSLVEAGWPARDSIDDSSRRSTLAVRPGGLFTWAVPMAAIGLRLAGAMPFSAVVVHESTPPLASESLEGDPTAVRLALLAGDGVFDIDAARDLAARIHRPPAGEANLDDLAAAVAAALDEITPGEAVRALTVALTTGIAMTERERLGRIAAPLTASDVHEAGGRHGLD